MRTPWRLVAGLLFAFNCILAPGAGLTERKIHQVGVVEIEANVGDEAYVDALVRELAKSSVAETPAAAVRLPFSLEDLATHRNRILAKISGYLALEKPSDFMTRAYDYIPEIWRSFQRLTIGQPRRFALWRRADLLAHLDAGEKVPGFVREGKTGLRVDLRINYDFKDEMTAEERQAREAAAWREVVWPVKLGADPDETPEQAAASALQELQSYRREIAEGKSAQLQFSQVFNVLHETVESGIVWSYITSRDRRWFCDGMANYLAWKIIAGEIGPDAARQYYDLDAELRKYAAEAKQVNLAAWPAAENMDKAGYREQLNTANYAYATKVIADFCAKHGESWMPLVFREMARTPAQKATIDTLYRAVRKVTGDDLRKYLPKAPKPR